MSELKVEADPAEVGLDADRLERIGRHFRGYVDGRLPGWLITVSRHGRRAYVAAHGSRDLEAGTPVETGTLWRIYSMTKPITSVGRDDAVRGGRLRAHRSGQPLHPLVGDVRVFDCGSDLKAVTVPATQPVRIWHLLTHTSGLTYGFHRSHPVDAMTGRPGSSGTGRRAWTWRRPVSLGRPAVAVPAGRGMELLGVHRGARAGGRGRQRGALDEFLAERIFGPLGMTDTAFWTGDAGGWPRYTPGAGRRAARLDALGRAGAQAADPARRGWRAGVHGRGLRPLHSDAAGPPGQHGRGTGWRPACSARRGRYGTWPATTCRATST